jgi:hypothetical protein
MCCLDYMVPTTTAANDESVAEDLLVPPVSACRIADVERPSSIGRVEAVEVVAASEMVEAAG